MSASETPKILALIERLRDWNWLADYANGGWAIPPAGTEALKKITAKAADALEQQERTIAALRADLARHIQIAAEHASENERLRRELAEVKEQLRLALDSEMDKLLAMPDDRIQAALRLEGRDPKDAATITDQAAELAILRVELAEERARRERAEDALATLQGAHITQSMIQRGTHDR